MPSIDELKTNTSYTGSGTAAGTPDGGVLDFGSINMKKPKNYQSSKKQSENDEFSVPKRKIADLSTLPEEELVGVEIKKSIEDEVFKEGGDFEKYRNQKIQEMMEINDLIDQHNAQVAANLGIDVPTDDELEKIGQTDMTPAIIGTKYYDQSDTFGRSKGEMKTSPLEQKAAQQGKTIDQYLSGQDEATTTILNENGELEAVKVADDSVPTNLDFEEEDEYMDEMEKELNEEFDTPKRKVSIITGEEKKEQPKKPEPKEEIVTNETIEELEEDLFTEDESAIETEDAKEEIKEETPVEDKPRIKKEEPKEKMPSIEITKIPKKETHDSDISDVVKDPNVGINVDFNIDEEDMEDVDLEADDDQPSLVEEISDADNLDEFKSELSEKIRPVANKLNLASFTIVNKPVSLSPAIMETDRVAMSWVLPNSGQYIAMSEFTGQELEQLTDYAGTDRFQTMRNRYKLFYDHIISPKPDTLEQWLKTISFADIDHLFFAVYGANFAGSNFIPYDCPGCKTTFLSENIPLEDMYKFENEESEKKFKEIRESQKSTMTGLYVSEVTQISDKIAIGFRDPSIYTMIFEPIRLDEKFLNKYRDPIAIISYIDNIYYINAENQTLSPINYKVDVNNMAKTVKAKIITYAKILKNLSPDQYYIILSYIGSISQKTTNIKYVKPEVICPKCGTTIPEEDVRAEDLVFTRARLASLTLTSLN